MEELKHSDLKEMSNDEILEQFQKVSSEVNAISSFVGCVSDDDEIEEFEDRLFSCVNMLHKLRLRVATIYYER